MPENLLVYVKLPDDKYIYLRDALTREMGLSRSLLTRLKQQHKIKVNGRWTLTDYKLKAGDVITVDLAFDESNPIEPRPLHLDIIYEDQDFLVIDKPAGLAVQPTRDPGETTLAHAISYYHLQRGLSSLFRPINRLDKNTSGLILIGKSQYAHQALFNQMKLGRVKRRYIALVEGSVEADSGLINLPIAHLHPESDPRRSVSSNGKEAATEFKVLEWFDAFTLLSLTLGTGRTHQIRVHMSHIGHPVCGDPLYGNPSRLISRQALHAACLSFTHPRSTDLLELEAPIPADISDLMIQIRSTAK